MELEGSILEPVEGVVLSVGCIVALSLPVGVADLEGSPEGLEETEGEQDEVGDTVGVELWDVPMDALLDSVGGIEGVPEALGVSVLVNEGVPDNVVDAERVCVRLTERDIDPEGVTERDGVPVKVALLDGVPVKVALLVCVRLNVLDIDGDTVNEAEVLAVPDGSTVEETLLDTEPDIEGGRLGVMEPDMDGASDMLMDRDGVIDTLELADTVGLGLGYTTYGSGMTCHTDLRVGGCWGMGKLTSKLQYATRSIAVPGASVQLICASIWQCGPALPSCTYISIPAQAYDVLPL
jgi:hypothetical protein